MRKINTWSVMIVSMMMIGAFSTTFLQLQIDGCRKNDIFSQNGVQSYEACIKCDAGSTEFSLNKQDTLIDYRKSNLDPSVKACPNDKLLLPGVCSQMKWTLIHKYDCVCFDTNKVSIYDATQNKIKCIQPTPKYIKDPYCSQYYYSTNSYKCKTCAPEYASQSPTQLRQLRNIIEKDNSLIYQRCIKSSLIMGNGCQNFFGDDPQKDLEKVLCAKCRPGFIQYDRQQTMTSWLVKPRAKMCLSNRRWNEPSTGCLYYSPPDQKSQSVKCNKCISDSGVVNYQPPCIGRNNHCTYTRDGRTIQGGLNVKVYDNSLNLGYREVCINSGIIDFCQIYQNVYDVTATGCRKCKNDYDLYHTKESKPDFNTVYLVKRICIHTERYMIPNCDAYDNLNLQCVRCSGGYRITRDKRSCMTNI